MKHVIALAFLAIAGTAFAQPVSLTYPDIVKEARRIERLEGSEYVLSNAVRGSRVRLNLRAFGGGSDSYFVDKKDEIGFICASQSKSFRGGVVEAIVVKHEPGAEGGHFFTLDNCVSAK